MRLFYEYGKSQPIADQLSWSHYIELLPIKDKDKLKYYLNLSIKQNLSRNDLRKRIKNNEYERLDDKIKEKLKENKINNEVTDYIKNPILINNKNNYNEISEKMLQKIILEDIESFLKDLQVNLVRDISKKIYG